MRLQIDVEKNEHLQVLTSFASTPCEHNNDNSRTKLVRTFMVINPDGIVTTIMETKHDAIICRLVSPGWRAICFSLPCISVVGAKNPILIKYLQ